MIEREGLLSFKHHHHHHVVLVARISLTLSRHSSLSFIALGRSSGQHPASSHSCWMYVRAGHPAFAQPCVGVHKSTSLQSLTSSFFFHSRLIQSRFLTRRQSPPAIAPNSVTCLLYWLISPTNRWGRKRPSLYIFLKSTHFFLRISRSITPLPCLP